MSAPAVWVDRSRSPVRAKVTLPPNPRNLEALWGYGIDALADERPDTFTIGNTRRSLFLATRLAGVLGGCWFIIRQSNHDAQWCTRPCMGAKPETAEDCTCSRCKGVFHGYGVGRVVTNDDPALVLVSGPTTTEIRRWIA